MLIRKASLNAVLPATTSEDTRYFLDAIQVEPDNALVATNGHILIKVRDTSPIADEDFPMVPGAAITGALDTAVLLPSDTARKLIAATPKKTSLPVLQTVRIGKNGEENTSIAVATDLQVPAIAVLRADDIGQTFPKYDRIWPKADRPNVQIILGVPLLETLIKSAKAIGSKGVRFTLPTEGTYQEQIRENGESHGTGLINSAITVNYRSDGLEVSAILMPMRE